MFHNHRNGTPGRLARLALSAVLLAGLVLSLLPAAAARAASTWTVNSTADPGNGTCDVSECTLAEAITAAAGGDTINFDPSLAGATITIGYGLLIERDLTIDGSGLSPHIQISGNHFSTAFDVVSGVTVTIKELDIINCSGEMGGGIYNAGNLTIINSFLSGNHAYFTGGGIVNWGTLTIVGTTFSNNLANTDGGAIWDWGTSAEIVNSTFSGNSASGKGGGIYSFDSYLTIKVLWF